MKEKKAKIPKIFALNVKEKKFQKKLLSRIQIESDKEFILNLYKLEGEVRTRPQELKADEVKRLRDLAKAVKQNKGSVKTVRIIVLLVIVGGIVAFNLLFKDRLFESAVERGLEAVFQAKSDVTGATIGIFKGRIAFEHMVVAREDKPFRNLFELGPTEIHFLVSELLKGKIAAKTIECTGIAWNTKRETSGSLEEERVQEAEATTNDKEIRFQPADLLEMANIDPQQLLDEQLENLKSLSLLQSVNTEVQQMTEDWAERIDDFDGKLGDLSGRIDEVRDINPAKLKSLPDIQAAMSKAGKAAEEVESLGKDIEVANREVKNGFADLKQKQKDIRDAMESDFAYLESFVSVPGGGLRGLLSSAVTDIVRAKLGNIYDYGLLAKSYGERFFSGKKEKKEGTPSAGAASKKRSDRGFNVQFPTVQYPKYLLENLSLSAQGTGGIAMEGFLRDLSSDPDLWDKPTTFQYVMEEAERRLEATGKLDARKERRERLNMDLLLAGYPFDLPEGIPVLGIKRLDCAFTLDTTLTYGSDASTQGRALLSLNGFDIDRTGSKNPLTDAVYEALTETAAVDFDIDYSLAPETPPDIRVRSNLDEIIAAKVEEYIDDLIQDTRANLEKELRRRLEKELGRNENLSGIYREIEAATGGQFTNVQGYEKLLKNKEKDLQKELKGLEKKIQDKAEKEVEKQLESVKDQIKIPGF